MGSERDAGIFVAAGAHCAFGENAALGDPLEGLFEHLAGVRFEHDALAGSPAARVHLVDAPRIDGAETLGMAAEIVTSVEGGNEIGSRASTFTAYLGDYYAFTTLISDPGSPDAALTPQFAADLLVKTVSALRG